jgi:nitrous oxidase accessory protein
MKTRTVCGVLTLLAALLSVAPAQAASLMTDHFSLFPDRLVVSPLGPYTTLESALADAHDGDAVEVRGGAYPALWVNKSVKLEGIGWPVIDGGGRGTVVTLSAPGIVFRGFEVRGSGVEPDRDHAGITLSAPDILVEDNRLQDVLFGIFVAQADRAVVRGNEITSKAEYDEARQGDGIRLWYSADVLLERNHVHDSRDVVIWYSKNVVMRENVIEGGRYGIHLMYCDGAQIERNRLRDNSVGIYTMYSNGVTVSGNDVRGQRGPSGYALGFKDAEDVSVTGNLLADNRAGAFLDGTPFSPQGYARFADNVFAFNDVGVILLTATRGNTFEGNTFWENVEQVALQGRGQAGANDWRHNYWSDYTGFDADGNGLGDTPYTAERFFESLTDREPILRALIYSPAAQTIEFAAEAFPIVKPQPKLADPAPRMQPAALTAIATEPRAHAPEMILTGLGLLLGGLACGGLTLFRGGHSMNRKSLPAEDADPSRSEPKYSIATVSAHAAVNQPAISVQNVSKRYGTVTALDGVSFEAHPGEAIALWGENGAGKTTLLKAILGLIDFKGRILVEGHDVNRDGKGARRSIGYVPQEAVFYDLNVRATMEFYARLKKVDLTRSAGLLDKLGLTAHARKPVSALSGGLKQRLALAIALLADPPVLLLDEPTANLDAKARRDYLALLAALRQDLRKTILFASHRVEEVKALASRVLVLESGQIGDIWLPGDMRWRPAPDVEVLDFESERGRLWN